MVDLAYNVPQGKTLSSCIHSISKEHLFGVFFLSGPLQCLFIICQLLSTSHPLSHLITQVAWRGRSYSAGTSVVHALRCIKPSTHFNSFIFTPRLQWMLQVVISQIQKLRYKGIRRLTASKLRSRVGALASQLWRQHSHLCCSCVCQREHGSMAVRTSREHQSCPWATQRN